MKKCYATIHVWLDDMDHNIDLNYRRKIRPLWEKDEMVLIGSNNVWCRLFRTKFLILLWVKLEIKYSNYFAKDKYDQ